MNESHFEGLTTTPSSFGPKETMDWLEAEMPAKGVTVFGCIDHSGGKTWMSCDEPEFKLLIKPGGSGFVGSNAQKIGPDTQSRRRLSFLSRANHTRIGGRSRRSVAGTEALTKNHIARAIF